MLNWKEKPNPDPESNGGDRRLPLTLWQAMYSSAVKFGPWAVMAAFLVRFVTQQVVADMREIKDTAKTTQSELHDHIGEQRFYLGALCYMMAKQSGEPPEICRPPLPREAAK